MTMTKMNAQEEASLLQAWADQLLDEARTSSSSMILLRTGKKQRARLYAKVLRHGTHQPPTHDLRQAGVCSLSRPDGTTTTCRGGSCPRCARLRRNIRQQESGQKTLTTGASLIFLRSRKKTRNTGSPAKPYIPTAIRSAPSRKSSARWLREIGRRFISKIRR